MIKMRERELLALIVIVVTVLAIASMTGGGGMGFMMGPWMMGGGGWMGIGMILFWIPIGVGIYLLMMGYAQPKRQEYDRSLAIAKERYARGEITLEDYEKLKRNLSQT